MSGRDGAAQIALNELGARYAKRHTTQTGDRRYARPNSTPRCRSVRADVAILPAFCRDVLRDELVAVRRCGTSAESLVAGDESCPDARSGVHRRVCAGFREGM